MKQFIFGFILILATNVSCQESNDFQKVLDEIVSHAEEASLYRDKISWDTIRPEIDRLAKDAQSIEDLKPALRYLLRSLEDDHGRVFYNNQIIANYYSTELKEHQKSFDPEIYNRMQMGQTYEFHSEMLEDKIGYIRIVGLPTGDNEKMASEIQDQVCRLINEGAQNWVVDLRYNGGGNLNPMAEGVALLIGNGIIGGAEGLTEIENSV